MLPSARLTTVIQPSPIMILTLTTALIRFQFVRAIETHIIPALSSESLHFVGAICHNRTEQSLFTWSNDAIKSRCSPGLALQYQLVFFELHLPLTTFSFTTDCPLNISACFCHVTAICEWYRWILENVSTVAGLYTSSPLATATGIRGTNFLAACALGGDRTPLKTIPSQKRQAKSPISNHL